ncbi:MAG: hypothetical protein ABIH20_02250 [Candidatus Diapherotrites archaeon]
MKPRKPYKGPERREAQEPRRKKEETTFFRRGFKGVKKYFKWLYGEDDILTGTDRRKRTLPKRESDWSKQRSE